MFKTEYKTPVKDFVIGLLHNIVYKSIVMCFF